MLVQTAQSNSLKAWRVLEVARELDAVLAFLSPLNFPNVNFKISFSKPFLNHLNFMVINFYTS